VRFPLVPDEFGPHFRLMRSDLLNAGWRKLCQSAMVGTDNRVARRFGSFGKGSLLGFPLGVFYNEQYIHIGSQTMIGPYASITAGMAPGQKMVTNPVVAIGDRCVIGRGSHIIGHFSIDIGDEVQTGPNVYITDQNHVYEDPDVPVGRQWPTEKAVKVGSGAWLGTNVVVLPGADIGRNAVIGAGSVVNGSIPDLSVAVGSPARVIKKYVDGRGWVRVGPESTEVQTDLEIQVETGHETEVETDDRASNGKNAVASVARRRL
jgi:serine acetyltransferase